MVRLCHGCSCPIGEMAQFHELSWQLYQEALYSDYRDIQGGTTAEGFIQGHGCDDPRYFSDVCRR